MQIKRIVFILIGIMLIGFGVGIYSLIYIDDFRLSNSPGFYFRNIDSNENDEHVKIGPGGIEVRDGDEHVSIGLDGIKVRGSDEHVSIGLDGIKVIDGDEKVIVGLDGIDIDDGNNNRRINISNLFGWGFGNQKEYNIAEEKTESIDGVNSLDISSSFVDIEINTEDRADIYIKYSGRIKSNVLPKLVTRKSGSNLIIKLDSGNSHSVSYSNAKLEISIPSSLKADFDISGSSADLVIENIISDNFEVSTSSGNIGLSNIKADEIELTSSSGNIKCQDIMGDVKANSSSGDMSFNLNESTGRFDISSSSGDINIQYNNQANYNGRFNTSSGDLINNGPMSINKANRSSYEFSLGDGEKELKINTSSGDFSLSYK